MLRFLSLGLLLIGATSYAADTATPSCTTAPKIPAPGLHMSLLDKANPTALNARAFFDARKSQVDCRLELSTLRASYLTEREKLAKMAGSADLDGIDDQGSIMEQARDEWVAKLRECGNCWSQEVELCSVATAGRTEYWYVGDGSCQVESTDTALLVASFQKQSEALVTADAYRHYKGGLPNVLDFYFVDPVTGQKKNDAKVSPASPFFSFIAVKGPSIFGVQVGFGYYYKNQINASKVGNSDQLVLSFQSERPPRGFQYPTSVPLVLASGRKRNAKHMTITRVQGMWYMTSEGYLRYYTAADLGMNLDYAKKAAQSTMLTTLATMYERGTGEAP